MNSIKLSRISVLQLVHADAQTERVVFKGKMTVIVAVLGIVLLAIGYASMIYMNELEQKGIIIALITVTVGTYLLFGTFLPLIVNKLKGNKKRSEKGLNAFTFAQLNFRINSLTKVLATVTMLIALGAGAISGGMAFKNNVMLTVDRLIIYDVTIDYPTAEEKKILDGIHLKRKVEYRYKTDDKYVYYLKEDLEKNRPLVQDLKDSKGMKDIGKLKRVSGELSVGAILSFGQEKSDNVIPKEWDTALSTIQPGLCTPNQTIKIVDQKMYDGLQGKEGVALLGKVDNFLT